jgi:hypothetical protein
LLAPLILRKCRVDIDGLILGESSFFFLLHGDQAHESLGFKWRQRVDLRMLGLGLDTSMLNVSRLVRRLAGVRGVKRVSSVLAKL